MLCVFVVVVVGFFFLFFGDDHAGRLRPKFQRWRHCCCPLPQTRAASANRPPSCDYRFSPQRHCSEQLAAPPVDPSFIRKLMLWWLCRCRRCVRCGCCGCWADCGRDGAMKRGCWRSAAVVAPASPLPNFFVGAVNPFHRVQRFFGLVHPCSTHRLQSWSLPPIQNELFGVHPGSTHRLHLPPGRSGR